MESKWKTGAKKTEILFTNRSSCVNYMQILLSKGLFWRARKLIPKRKEKPGAKEEKDNNATHSRDEGEARKRRKDKQEEGAPQEGKDKQRTGKDRDEDEEKKQEDEGDKKKKSKKIKLDFHSEQIFRDGPDVYVWHFDPTHWTKFLLGLGIVIGSIVLCLFPLWPPWMRMGVYYVSVVAMGFVGLLLGLIVLRSIVFGVVWAVSFGKHHLWILPNLTEDCGFFESFKPAYSYTYKGGDGKGAKKKKKKDKDSSSEAEGKEETEAQNTDTDREGSESQEGDSPAEDEDDEEQNNTPSATENSAPGTPRGKKGKNRRKDRRREDAGPDGNEFEMLDSPQDEIE